MFCCKMLIIFIRLAKSSATVFIEKNKTSTSMFQTLTLEGGGILRLRGLICLGWWDSMPGGALVSPRGFRTGEVMSWRGREGEGFRPWAGRSDRSVGFCCWVSWLRMGEGSGWVFRSTGEETDKTFSTVCLNYSDVTLINYSIAFTFGTNNLNYCTAQ